MFGARIKPFIQPANADHETHPAAGALRLAELCIPGLDKPG